MDSLIPLFRRSRVSPKPRDHIPMSNLGSTVHLGPGLFRLPLEIRLEIYAYLFSDSRRQSTSAKAEKYMIPFDHVSSGLIFTNRQLLLETINYIYAIPRITFPRPELCSLTFTICRPLLSRLSVLEITLKAYETHLLDPIFDLVLEAQAPLTDLTLNLVPTYPGQVIFPIPRYVILRDKFRLRPQFEGGVRPWAPRCNHDHSFFGFHSNDSGTGVDVALSQSSLGKLASLRQLKITGQAECSQEFELAMMKLHSGMKNIARREGKEIELAECCGVRNGSFYFEVWIS
ncbi:hypothetical protein DL95DRAFT_379635 [Leptodontidium sp. 2 PMI_412]|nr:hypothetical protein DL95DRAFT_379635 [Leptodontidium sp. 2 PMI_412]